ncbi:dihydrolipoyl dehydrogenase [Streptococcus sp. CSL10205-OR2]|uniref:dihydrolipoyl dehydrogenase n=1 Tax=Streptococcus sp. CSL10205-OR2 TaxID=2980558 RepID=UPI0021DA0F41|nr:dihydrolipoyl dehydrogenase [Streptococcus sp. CSL10205-OR2]MCU9533449.1 dihydrolipoyl dehydrogenase [Streptococcus sp. CSL10205-OR2]
MKQYDILIIGAGPGGYVAAEEAAKNGKKVAVIERSKIGGTCLNVGCIPSKTYLQHSHWLQTFKEAEQFGIHSEIRRIDFSKLVDRKNQVVSTLQAGIHSTFKGLGIDFIEGDAEFVKDKQFKVNNQLFSGKNIILATGSHPFIPPINGIDKVSYLTTDTFFDLKELPQKLVIIGGGVIAIELAFAMAPLGIDVTVVEVAPEILLTEDEAARKIIKKELTSHLGVKIFERAKIQSITKDKVLLESKEITYSHLLIATGRKPNLDLAKAMGLELTSRQFVKVDDYYETSQAGVYAIGDLIESYMLAHVASKEGIKAVKAILRNAEEVLDQTSVPRALYTNPEVASFGLSEAEAKEAGYDPIVKVLPFSYNGRAIASNETKGFVKLISEKKYHQILGAVIVGPHSTDLLQSLILLKDAEATYDQVVESIFAHPTVSELIQEVSKNVVTQ